jgi:hypothetical protein
MDMDRPALYLQKNYEGDRLQSSNIPIWPSARLSDRNRSHPPPFDPVCGGGFGFRLSGDQGACGQARIGFYAFCASPKHPGPDDVDGLSSTAS